MGRGDAGRPVGVPIEDPGEFQARVIRQRPEVEIRDVSAPHEGDPRPGWGRHDGGLPGTPDRAFTTLAGTPTAGTPAGMSRERTTATTPTRIALEPGASGGAAQVGLPVGIVHRARYPGEIAGVQAGRLTRAASRPCTR